MCHSPTPTNFLNSLCILRNMSGSSEFEFEYVIQVLEERLKEVERKIRYHRDRARELEHEKEKLEQVLKRYADTDS